MKLTPAQQRAKDALRTARAAQKTARSRFDAEMEIAWRERSAAVNQAVLEAVQDAVRTGVPKTQIGQAYGSKDYNTIRRLIDSVKITAAKADAIAVHVDYDLAYPDTFLLTLKNFDDWTSGGEALSGTVRYDRFETGDWITSDRSDLARAVERDLWHESPLRTQVAKVVPLDSLPMVVEDYEDDEDDEYDDGEQGNPDWIF